MDYVNLVKKSITIEAVPTIGLLHPRKIAPNPKTNCNPNPNTNRGAIFFEGNCLVAPKP